MKGQAYGSGGVGGGAPGAPGGGPPVAIIPGLYCGQCGRLISRQEQALNGGLCNACYVQRFPNRVILQCPNCIRGNPPHIHQQAMGGALGGSNCQVCGYLFTPIRCPRCQGWIDSNSETCFRCRWRNPSFTDTRVRVTKTMQKRVSGKVYEIAMFEIIGAFLFLGLPLLGLPSMPFLAVAIMAFLPLYHFLPDENEAIASRQRGTQSLGREAGGLLVLKSVAKTAMFGFAIFDFYRLPISKLIPLVISWIYYFKLPVSYKETHPFEMIEAWIRVGVGALIAFLIFIAFNSSFQGMSLLFMAVAFFCTSFPRHRHADPEDRGQVQVSITEIIGKVPGLSGENVNRIGDFLEGGGIQEKVLNIAFLFFMTAALTTANVGLSYELSLGLWGLFGIMSMAFLLNMSRNVGHLVMLFVIVSIAFAVALGMFSSNMMNNTADMLQIIFFAVWELSVITGLIGGKESRPFMGILMILMALFVFSFTATGVMGTAIFGYWWPQIESTVGSITAPLGPLWDQVQSSMSDSWLMLTNPMAYYDQLNKRTQATKSVVQNGGTVKSIELTRTDLFTSVTGELEPIHDPLIGSFEIENQGEFQANKITLDLWATWHDPSTTSATNPIPPETTGQLDYTKFSCSKPFNTATSTPSSGSGQIGTCVWDQITYPQEIKTVNFVFSKGAINWKLDSGTLADCVNDDCTIENATFKHSGQEVKINVNLTYDYNVNVSIPIEIINQAKYQNLLQARQITLQELTSQYTGGPVKATLWSQKQPVRDSGELSLFVASIVNEGGGTLNQTKSFIVLIPKDIVDMTANPNSIEIVAQTFKNSTNLNADPDGCGSGTSPLDGNAIRFPNYWVIYCVHNLPMKNGEYKRVSFFVTPKGVSDRKTSLIVGLANYEYIKTGSAGITVANAPWH